MHRIAAAGFCIKSWGFLGSLGPLLRLSLLSVCYFDRFSVVRSDTPQKSGSQQHFWPAPLSQAENNSTKGIALLNGRREPQGTAGFPPSRPALYDTSTLSGLWS